MKPLSIETQRAVFDELEWCGALMDAMQMWFGSGMPVTEKMLADVNVRLAATEAALAKARAEMGTENG